MVDRETNYHLGERAFTQLVAEHAKRDAPAGETEAQGFTRLFTAPTEEGVLLRKAHAIAKSAPFAGVVLDLTPKPVTPADFQPRVISGGDWWDADDAAQAMDQLREIGRRMAPTATPERQFAVAFEAPANAALAQRAHRRPSPSTVFAMPYASRGSAYAKSDPAPNTDTAYDELMVKAEAYQTAHPDLSIARCFEKIYTDRANVELAKRERAESAPR